MDRRLTALAAATLVCWCSGACDAADGGPSETQREAPTSSRSVQPSAPRSPFDASLANEWMDLVVERARVDGLSPPEAARAIAYVGLALYEPIAQGDPSLRSLAGQLRGLRPLPEAPLGPVFWPAAAVASAARVAEAVLADTATDDIGPLLAAQYQAFRAAGVSPEALERSRAHGEAIGRVLVRWAASDGAAEALAKPYTPPTELGQWDLSETGGAPPTDPHWSSVRTMALSSADACAPPAPEPYSDALDATFHRDAMVVYEVGRDLDDEQREIAFFWADAPSTTGTPAGHWALLAGQLADDLRLSLEQTVELYALLGVGLSDAFVSCWEAKYRHMGVRPETYIHQNIDPEWESLIRTPPFPEYPSGHSVVSGAAATIMAEVLGAVPFEDRTVTRYGLPPRAFRSVAEAAGEAAISRLYGGIHFRPAIEEGLEQGACVGQTVLGAARTRVGATDGPGILEEN
jgi:hypothetical protein